MSICTNAATAAIKAVAILFFAFVGLPAGLIVSLMAWGAVFSLSGVEFDVLAFRCAANFLVSMATFFGIILGTYFGVALTFGFLVEMLKDVLWRRCRSDAKTDRY